VALIDSAVGHLRLPGELVGHQPATATCVAA
jgi:hypothetical protein